MAKDPDGKDISTVIVSPMVLCKKEFFEKYNNYEIPEADVASNEKGSVLTSKKKHSRIFGSSRMDIQIVQKECLLLFRPSDALVLTVQILEILKHSTRI